MKIKSIKIYGLDDTLWVMIKAKSKSERLNINKTIINILETAFGIKPKISKECGREFKEFLGIWSEIDLAEFNKAIKGFEIIDKEEWL